MNIKNLGIAGFIGIFLQVSLAQTALAEDKDIDENCNQVAGEARNVRSIVKSYQVLHLSVIRNSVDGITARGAQVMLLGETTDGNPKKVEINWVFSNKETAKNQYPTCSVREEGYIRIVIPYEHWQMPAMMKLLSTAPETGIRCNYGSSADRSEISAICYQQNPM